MLAELDIDPKWEVNRSHWAVKNVDLANVLLRAGLLTSGTLGPLRRPPQVFISYSWDSPEHRAWITQLAMTLRQNGIEVTLDQWHVRPGEDLAHFMARGVRESDRVLMICTENYVQKAQQRQGGVGYEQMLVTAQIMREVGTAKFVPIIRQTNHPRQLPDELAGRMYVDLSDGPEQPLNLQRLIRDLHDVSLPLPLSGCDLSSR
ncbi:toll/interleukin-1 receptor domain-containing protein [Paucibacter sp. O1-1]|nr:toll/interleukin-1 receptor domain-containing protein [Paucibacter sp. O1-1]MCU7369515.1 toll/interleukin-1 receptor domain-containing protein [Paucibacter sp. O1-1]MDA3824478.1 toll/interleukin-1 receptor domain-containing protein [Paucibacter sp. O1-1]MDA3824499.1 toll/interleukin-1 receptor domain-containing protein [Paucibacter sp. O1-1]